MKRLNKEDPLVIEKSALILLFEDTPEEFGLIEEGGHYVLLGFVEAHRIKIIIKEINFVSMNQMLITKSGGSKTQ